MQMINRFPIFLAQKVGSSHNLISLSQIIKTKNQTKLEGAVNIQNIF